MNGRVAGVMARSVNVLVVDDHELARVGLAALAERLDGVRVVGVVPDGRTALRRAQFGDVDVVLADVVMPSFSGAALCRALAVQAPAVRVLLISGFLQDSTLDLVRTSGAAGFLTKAVDASTLGLALHQVAAGRRVVDARIAARLADWPATVIGSSLVLSPRELEVLRLVVNGATTAAAAHTMGISINTAKTLVQRAYRKLGCTNRVEAAIWAADAGLV